MKPMTLRDVANEHPSFIFELVYYVWHSPHSRKRRQEHIKGVTAEELKTKYGNFVFESWYTTSRNPDNAIVWAMATENEFLYDTLKENDDEHT